MENINKFVLFGLLLLISACVVRAGIAITIVTPSAGWNNNDTFILNVTTSRTANVSFNTSSYATLTTLFNESTQGNITLNATYLNEGNNTIYIYSRNSTNTSETNTTSVANVAVDTAAPNISYSLTNQSVQYGFAFSYDVNATDDGPLAYFINDTTNFAISAAGVITNATVLSLDTNYQLNITINDTLNNRNSTTLNVTVTDTTKPTFTQTPANHAFEFGSALLYDVNATDNHNVSYFINDTTNFAINSSGHVTNATYFSFNQVTHLNISINDSKNNLNATAITVSYTDTTAPTWAIALANQSVAPSNLFRYDVNATDTANVSQYFVNDTTNFVMNSSNGTILNNSAYNTPRTLWINVSVNDTSNNVLSQIIKLTVRSAASSTSGTGGGGGGSSSTKTTILTTETNVAKMKSNSQISFTVGTEDHSVAVTSFRAGEKAEFKVSSSPQYLWIKVGETKKVDANNDNILDIAITVNKVTSSYVDATFEKISEVVEVITPTKTVEPKEPVVLEESEVVVQPQQPPKPSPKPSPITGAAVTQTKSSGNLVVGMIALAIIAAGIFIYVVKKK